MKSYIIAIDGPAASGKSTLASLLADELGIVAVNSGLFYRAFTWAVLEAKISPSAEQEIKALVASLELAVTFHKNHIQLAIRGNERPLDLRSGKVNATVATVSAHPFVRDRVNRELQHLAAHGPCIVEGRDIGTAVFPDTPFKLFLDAPIQIREKRRLAQGEADDIAARDAADTNRAMSPLQSAADAAVITVADKSPAEVLAAALRLLEERGMRTARQSCDFK